MDMPMDYHVSSYRVQCHNAITDFLSTLPSWWLLHWQYGMIFHRNSLIRQSYHFTIDFDRMLLQPVDILNILFRYWVCGCIHHWNVWAADVQLCKVSSLIREHIQCAKACPLEKVNCCLRWTTSVISINLHDTLREYTHIQSLKICPKFILPSQKYITFSRGLLFIGAPCRPISDKRAVRPMCSWKIAANHRSKLMMHLYIHACTLLITPHSDRTNWTGQVKSNQVKSSQVAFDKERDRKITQKSSCCLPLWQRETAAWRVLVFEIWFGWSLSRTKRNISKTVLMSADHGSRVKRVNKSE